MSLETGNGAQGVIHGVIDRADEVGDRVHGFQVLVERQIPRTALAAHFEQDVGFSDTALRGQDEPLPFEHAPVPVDLIVSTDDILDVEPSAGVDLHRMLLRTTDCTSILTYVNIGVLCDGHVDLKESQAVLAAPWAERVSPTWHSMRLCASSAWVRHGLNGLQHLFDAAFLNQIGRTQAAEKLVPRNHARAVLGSE